MLAQLKRDLTNFIYPPICVGCRSLKGDPASDFCAACDESLGALAGAFCCPRCAAPIPDGSGCPFCRGAGISPFQQIAALGAFRGSLRGMVHEMKYHHRWPLAEALATKMLTIPRISKLLDETDLLVPTPLHWSRHIRRGYNQAQAIADCLGRHGKRLVIAQAIVRLKNTPAQTTVRSRQDRAANLRFAFGLVNPSKITGKRITLVDDVLTTGATLKAAAQAVKQASPASINAIVLAVADPRRRDFQTV